MILTAVLGAAALIAVICIVIWIGGVARTLNERFYTVQQCIEGIVHRMEHRNLNLGSLTATAREAFELQFRYQQKVAQELKKTHDLDFESFKSSGDADLQAVANAGFQLQPVPVDMTVYPQLMQQISSNNEEVTTARDNLASAVRAYNVEVMSFPGSLIAAAKGYKELQTRKLSPELGLEPTQLPPGTAISTPIGTPFPKAVSAASSPPTSVPVPSAKSGYSNPAGQPTPKNPGKSRVTQPPPPMNL